MQSQPVMKVESEKQSSKIQYKVEIHKIAAVLPASVPHVERWFKQDLQQIMCLSNVMDCADMLLRH